MNIKRNAKLLGAGTLALLMAACASHKTTEAPPPPPAEQTGPVAPPANSGNSAESAQPSAAAGNGSLQSNQLGGDQSQANAGSGSDNGKSSGGDQSGATGIGQRTFYFDYDSSTLQSSDMASLQAHAAYLSKHSDAKLRVEGNADERGTREYNMALGERRAKAVAAYLTSNGASADQLTVISYGKEKPAVDGHDEASWAKNRRVELNYTAGQP